MEAQHYKYNKFFHANDSRQKFLEQLKRDETKGGNFCEMNKIEAYKNHRIRQT